MNREGYSRTEKSSDLYQTPKYFYKLLDNIFHFTLDPCTDKDNWLGTEKFYTKEDNGLKQNWYGETVFVNPPYSYIKEWATKCFFEGIKEDTIVVMIIPSRTDTKYWHAWIMEAYEIWFCKGRVNFFLDGIKGKSGSNFPLSIIIFGNKEHHKSAHAPIINPFYHKEEDLINMCVFGNDHRWKTKEDKRWGSYYWECSLCGQINKTGKGIEYD